MLSVSTKKKYHKNTEYKKGWKTMVQVSYISRITCHRAIKNQTLGYSWIYITFALSFKDYISYLKIERHLNDSVIDLKNILWKIRKSEKNLRFSVIKYKRYFIDIWLFRPYTIAKNPYPITPLFNLDRKLSEWRQISYTDWLYHGAFFMNEQISHAA